MPLFLALMSCDKLPMNGARAPCRIKLVGISWLHVASKTSAAQPLKPPAHHL